ncbi:protein MULTIPOLAR SPINDLE 1 isoform X3 [Juglans regia]|uniref:Protein MULTIPOLAR SPINDLE 1 isoform X3 n=1 Tax=Juglans regia TaxID=51240 RepID=A0A6P9EFE9_JUGRE|nr:protein MULTIPOLAR SPINDLE 1 isoform X3 [Juglans regia]
MSAGEHTTVAANTNTNPDDQSLKLALAISLLRSKFIQNRPPPTDRNESDALRWKRKVPPAHKLLTSQLRSESKSFCYSEKISRKLKCDLFPKSASCKCYFFDNLGKLSPQGLEDGSDRRFNDVLLRRFLRHVRFKERRRGAGASIQRRQFSVLNTEDEETEQLRASVDFLVELCDTVSPVGEANFANWAHQAVDFILASLKNILPRGKDTKLIEGIVNGLIMRLVRRMCSPSKVFESLHTGLDAQFYVQHLIRKLGSEAYVGQRAILLVSQRISVLAESFLFLDPFDDSFPGMHGCMFTLIQLIEFLISDYLLIWSSAEGFDKSMYRRCCFHSLTWCIYSAPVAFFQCFPSLTYKPK